MASASRIQPARTRAAEVLESMSGKSVRPDVDHLSMFDAMHAARVASWVATPQEHLWLAPATPPPMTAEKVLAWGQQRRVRYLFWPARRDVPAAYAELNPMDGSASQLWIGHFITDPHLRGKGIGTRFAKALIARAFVECGASLVSLVVFPDNPRAIRCYERAGLCHMGDERKYFECLGREFVLLRMGIRRSQYRKLVSRGQLPGEPLPLHGGA